MSRSGSDLDPATPAPTAPPTERNLARAGDGPSGDARTLPHDRRRTTRPSLKPSEPAMKRTDRASGNVKTSDNSIATRAKYVHPAFGDRRVDLIRRDDVLRVLRPIWTAKPEFGRKVRQRTRGMPASAQVHGRVEHALPGDAVDGALPSLPVVKAHSRALRTAKSARRWRDHRAISDIGVSEGVPAVRRAPRLPVGRGPLVGWSEIQAGDAERHDVDGDPAGHRAADHATVHGFRAAFRLGRASGRASRKPSAKWRSRIG